MPFISLFLICNGRSGSCKVSSFPVVAGCNVFRDVSNPICLRLWTGCDNYEAILSRKGHDKYSNYVCMSEFIQQLQDKGIENPSKWARTFGREMSVEVATMNMALNENLRYHSYVKCKGHILAVKAKVNRLMKANKLLSEPRYLVEPGKIWFVSYEKKFC